MDIETEYIPVFDSYPEPDAKAHWVQDYEQMVIHTQGKLPTSLISNRRPNESEDILQYRIDNFRPVTRHPFNQAKTNLKRTLSHSAVEIVYPEKIKELLQESRFWRTNFLSFMQKYVVDKMIDAANGRLVWWPMYNVGDVDKFVGLEPLIVMPHEIVHADEDVFTFLSKEKSLLEVGGEMLPLGKVFYIIGKDELWKRRQIGKPEENKWEFAIYAANPMGMVYALPLGGDEVACEMKHDNDLTLNYEYHEVHLFTSYFSPAVPFADECLVRFSDNQGVSVSCSSPLREVERVQCTAEGCKNGKIDITRHRGKREVHETVNCHTCHGSGYVPITGSPYGIVTRPARQRGVNDHDTSDIPVMRFIHPDTAILEYSDKVWQDFLKMTKDALNLMFMEQAQSGVAKEMDREDKLATLDKIGLHLYKYLITSSIQIIHKFTYPAEDIPVITVNLPQTFIIKDQTDIIADMTAMRNNGLPDFFMIEKAREYLQKEFGADMYRNKIFNTLVSVDPLFIKTESQKAILASATVISNSQMTWSFWATPVVEDFAKQQGANFANMPLDDIIKAVIPLIQAKVDATIAEVAALGPDGGTEF